MPQNYEFPRNPLSFFSKIFVLRARFSHFYSNFAEIASLSAKIPHRTELSGYFVTRNFIVQKWGVRIFQNFASIRNEEKDSSKIMLQLQTLHFQMRKLSGILKGASIIQHFNEKRLIPVSFRPRNAQKFVSSHLYLMENLYFCTVFQQRHVDIVG